MIFSLPGTDVTTVLNEPIKDTSGKEVAWRWGNIYADGSSDETIVVNHSISSDSN